MAKTLWQEETRRDLLARARRLTPASERRWGTLGVDAMLAHLVEAFRMGLGELPVRPKMLPIRHWPLNVIIVNWVPFPKNTPSASELFRAPRSIESELTALEEAMARFAARGDRTDWPEHPAFGRLSRAAWGRLGYKHTDHHLRQFGV